MLTIRPKHWVLSILVASASCGEAQQPASKQHFSEAQSPTHHDSETGVEVRTSKLASPLLATCAECPDCSEVLSTLMVATTPPTWLPGYETQEPI